MPNLRFFDNFEGYEAVVGPFKNIRIQLSSIYADDNVVAAQARLGEHRGLWLHQGKWYSCIEIEPIVIIERRAET
jgi:hypothetical protein